MSYEFQVARRLVSKSEARSWVKPDFQRDFRESARPLREVIEYINGRKEIPGVVTLGYPHGAVWLIDGQHRVEAFLRSEQETVFVTIYMMMNCSLTEAAQEYRRLQSKIAANTSGDKLRMLPYTGRADWLQDFRKQHPYIGERLTSKNHVTSLSLVLSSWKGAIQESPTYGDGSVEDFAAFLSMHPERRADLSRFIELLRSAWGDNIALWRSQITLTISGWIYLNTVVKAGGRSKLTDDLFQAGMCEVADEKLFLNWRKNKFMRDPADISGCYVRLKELIVRRCKRDGFRVTLPSPEWVSQSGRVLFPTTK